MVQPGVSQDAFGVVQGADFLGVMGKVLLRAAQFELLGHVVEFKEVAGTLPAMASRNPRPSPPDAMNLIPAKNANTILLPMSWTWPAKNAKP
jgi:hypothetical protein